MRIRIHASFLLLAVVVLMAGAASSWKAAAAEVGWIAVVFACVIVHELAHSITATRLGLKVKDIVLLPIGGMSEMERLPDDPRQEVAVAAAGPAASLLLAMVSLVAAASLGGRWWPPGLFSGSLLARLGWLNVLLGGFNLLPVLPMDGGRLLRAALERRLGPARSMVVAAGIGRLGAVLLLVAGLFYDWWLILIGVFILVGATTEQANARAHESLARFTVTDAMAPFPWTVDQSAWISREELAQAIQRQGALPVTVEGRYMGIIGPAGLRQAGAGARAGDIADRGIATVEPHDSLDHALDALEASGLRAVAVVNRDGTIAGLVTADRLGQLLATRQ